MEKFLRWIVIVLISIIATVILGIILYWVLNSFYNESDPNLNTTTIVGKKSCLVDEDCKYSSSYQSECWSEVAAGTCGIGDECSYFMPNECECQNGSCFYNKDKDIFANINSKQNSNTTANINEDPRVSQPDITISMSPSLIPATGQTNCFDTQKIIRCPNAGQNYYGQDGIYETNPLSYTDNGDGTVTDNNTGLMWTKNAGDKMQYSEAISLSGNYEFAGYNDWRVPTIKELYSLIDFDGEDIDPTSTNTDNQNPFIDTDYFEFKYGDLDSGERIIDSQWVTNTKYVSNVMNNQECFFGVNFADGRIKCYPTQTNKTYYLRLVRGMGAYGANDFQDNSDDTITDAITGLMWQQSDSGEGMDWPSALSYCENLDLAGYDDWRLPNAKELQYIVDYNNSPDTNAQPAIDGIFETQTIENELGQKDYPYFWTSTSHANSQGAANAVYISFGRALGKMNNQVMDVHGAGAQRSDPKIGDQADYPDYRGPQGDVVRVFNFVRCVRN